MIVAQDNGRSGQPAGQVFICGGPTVAVTRDSDPTRRGRGHHYPGRYVCPTGSMRLAGRRHAENA